MGDDVGAQALESKGSDNTWHRNEQPFHSQLCAFVRHTERADHNTNWAKIDESWVGSDDFRNWPKDAPLSSTGLEHATQLAQELNAHITANGVSFHVVVSSPYFRCVQTAVEICKALGPDVSILLDQQLGEIYGPECMGDDCPLHTHRPLRFLKDYGRRHGVQVRSEMVGHSPTWPEKTASARQRFANRFLRYIYRSLKARRNFLVVSHADAVASALSIIPTYDRIVTNVGYGGLFIASRQVCNEGLTLNVDQKGAELDLEELEDMSDTSPRLRAATTGWKVTTRLIASFKKSADTSLSKRILQFKQQSESNRDLIESLLGDLPEASLDRHCCWPKNKFILEDDGDVCSVSGASSGESTVLFGDDEGACVRDDDSPYSGSNGGFWNEDSSETSEALSNQPNKIRLTREVLHKRVAWGTSKDGHGWQPSLSTIAPSPRSTFDRDSFDSGHDQIVVSTFQPSVLESPPFMSNESDIPPIVTLASVRKSHSKVSEEPELEEITTEDISPKSQQSSEDIEIVDVSPKSRQSSEGSPESASVSNSPQSSASSPQSKLLARRRSFQLEIPIECKDLALTIPSRRHNSRRNSDPLVTTLMHEKTIAADDDSKLLGSARKNHRQKSF